MGVNGAGKSTTISILCGQLAKDSGQVKICGLEPEENIEAITRELGVVFQSSVLDGVLTVRDNLQSRAALYGITGRAFRKRLDELGELLGFQELLGRTVNRLSGGQRRRIDIARALLHRPRILILDEPTTGLDPQTRSLVWQVVEQLRRKEGITVFLTTHYMEEAADADYVVILDKGKIAAEGTPAPAEEYLHRRFSHPLWGDGKPGPGLGAALFGHTGCISRVGFQHRSGNGTDCEASGAVPGL